MKPICTQQRAAELLARLVACPSVNPGRRQSVEPLYGEGRLAELLAGMVSPWGADVRLPEVSPGRPNFIAHFPGADQTRSLMLEAHSDTVDVGDMTIEPFEPAIRDGRLYGRGSCDTKGAMAAMLLAMEAVCDADGLPPVDVYLVSTCDEEDGATGAQRLMAEGFRADAAVVGEPTDLALVHATKGAVRYHIETRGVPAHSSTPDRGISAIYHMRRVLAMIEDDVAASLAAPDKAHPLLGPPTISVGTIRGGTQVNVVPAGCEIEVDRRLVPGESAEQVAADLRQRVSSLAADSPSFEFACEQTQHYPPFEVSCESPLARRAADACRAVLGDARFATAAWASNAGPFQQTGIPCILFGPGSAGQAHTREEFIELAQVPQAAAVYAEIIRSMGRAQSS